MAKKQDLLAKAIWADRQSVHRDIGSQRGARIDDGRAQRQGFRLLADLSNIEMLFQGIVGRKNLLDESPHIVVCTLKN